MFWSSKIAKNNKTLQREYDHYIVLLLTLTSNEEIDQNNLLSWVYTSYNNSLYPSMIIVPELVMHTIELMRTHDHLNIKVH